MTEEKTLQLIMLCGIPTCGKSTFVENGLKTIDRSYVILSTDSYIERKALQYEMTYNDVFNTYIYEATKALNESLRIAVSFDKHIVWDQTNLTPKVRRKKLQKIPNHYLKTAVWFDVSLEDAMIRNQQRPGKIIPGEVLKNMHKSFIPPNESEGFDLIYKAK
jgi:predicted kinase